MPIRRVTEADIPMLLTAVTEVPNPPLENYQTMLQYLERDVIMVWPETGMICSIARNDRAQELSVRWLLPRAAWTEDNADELGRLLAMTLATAFEEWPDTRDWVIWAEFQAGLDRFGRPDGGEELCKFWAQRWKRRGRGPTVTSYERPDGQTVWRAQWSLREAKLKGDDVTLSRRP